MSTESNKAVVQRFRDRFNAGDLEGAFGCFAPNAVVHTSSSPEPVPMEGFRQLGQLMMNAFVGGTATIEDTIVEGETRS